MGVMLFDPHRKNKWEPDYLGPYTVVRRTHGGTYELRSSDGELLDRKVPADQLKLVSKTARDSDLADNVYEVQDILKHRGTPGHYEYYTAWKGYRDRTWEPQSSFQDAAIIQRYWNSIMPTDSEVNRA